MLVTLSGMAIPVRLVQLRKAPHSILVTLLGTALQFYNAYSLICFITHKSISYKELCQYFFSYYFMIIYHYPLLFNKYDVISGVTFHIIFFITPNKSKFQLPQTVFKNPLGRL